VIDFEPDELNEVLRSNLEVLFEDQIQLLAQKEKLLSKSWFTSCIPLHGLNKYIVLVECTEPLIQQISLFMFDRTEPPPSRAEMVDSIAECANIVGGLIKSELESPYSMGLPLAFSGDRGYLEILYTKEIAEFCYVCFGEPMRITIFGSI